MGTNGFQEPAVDFKDGKIVGTKRLYADGNFKKGKAMFMATKWRGLQAEGKEAEKDRFPFLINNGRANHVWQSVYLDQNTDFVMRHRRLIFRSTRTGLQRLSSAIYDLLRRSRPSPARLPISRSCPPWSTLQKPTIHESQKK
jgi:hypothetical protein